MFFGLKQVNRKLDQVLIALHELKTLIIQQGAAMSQELDTLTAQVKAATDVEASAVLLLQGLSAQIAANKTDPVKLQALSDSLKTQSDALAAAIVANTPAA